MIEFKNIVKSFGPKSVLDGVSFDVKTGEVFFIIGASGVGKSVLIKHHDRQASLRGTRHEVVQLLRDPPQASIRPAGCHEPNGL